MDDVARRTRSGTQTRQRTLRPSMACTPGERALLDAAAERAGMSVSMFMRHQCLGAAGPRAIRRPPIERVVLAALLAQLGPIRACINQIAKAANTTGRVLPDADKAIADVTAAAEEIMRALGKKRP